MFGKKLGIPVFAHESDLTLGLANKIAMQKGAIMLKANPHSKFKGTFVGMPLREELFCKDKTKALKILGINNPTNKKVLLILGGSLGAQAINDAVVSNIDELTKNYFVLHVFGKNKAQKISHDGYKCFEYADDISAFYAVSDIIVSRAGATAVFEISVLKNALFLSRYQKAYREAIKSTMPTSLKNTAHTSSYKTPTLQKNLSKQLKTRRSPLQ